VNPVSTSPETDGRVLSLVRRHGWNATSFQVLQPGFHYFFDGHGDDDDGCVAYVDTGRAWVAAGAPLCAPHRLGAVAERFLAAAHAAGRRPCFFGTEARFGEAVVAAGPPLRSLLIGEQAVWDPAGWEQTVAAAPSLREQLRRGRAKGVRVRASSAAELADAASPDHAPARALVARWLRTRELAPMGFLVDVDPLNMRDDHRLYLAEAGGRLVGLLAASPIFARRGWLLQALVRAPDAPNGTAELLVDEAMRAAAGGDDALVTLGLAPLAGQVAWPLRAARSAGATLYNFEGLRAFRAKLRPSRWDPVYLVFPERQGVAATVTDVLAAFARGRLLGFGLETLLRGPAVVVRLLALALVPWTLALAFTPAARWFPSPALKWGWVAFDALLVVALLSLARRWRHRLARLVTAAVAFDAVVTAGEAALWNVPRISTAGAAVVTLAALLAPALAFIVLWRARRRRLHDGGMG